MIEADELAWVMDTRQELLVTIEQLPDEKLRFLLDFAQTLKNSEGLSDQSMNIRSFLKLPPERQEKLLAQQALMLAPYFQPGTEAMEWVEDYLEDDLDDES